VKAAGTVAGADDTEPGALVQGEAGGVVGKMPDRRLQTPAASVVAIRGQVDASATDGWVDIHGVLDHVGIGRPLGGA
jgi:hypothetical protein